MTLAGIYAALHVAKLQMKDLRVLMFGAGTAGTGIADQISDAIAVESGKSSEEARKQIWYVGRSRLSPLSANDGRRCVDKPGLLLESHKDKLTPAQHPYAKADSEWESKEHSNLLEVIKAIKPHVLIGTSTQPGAFTEDIVREMASHVDRPIIFPLSNPTRLHEAKPADLFEWTDGKVLTATGSPFDPVDYKGHKYDIAECNNSTTFPGTPVT